MNHPRLKSFLAFIGCLALVSFFWTGCNSVDVQDEGSTYEKLSSASSVEEAKVAINSALSQVGIDGPLNAIADARFTLGEDLADALAENLVAFNRGDENSSRSFRQVYEILSTTNHPPVIGLDAAMGHFWDAVDLLKDQGISSSPVALAASHGDDPLVTDLESFGPDAPVSPVQAFMFSTWLLDRDASLVAYDELVGAVVSKVDALVPTCIDEGLPGGDIEAFFDTENGGQSASLKNCAKLGTIPGATTCRVGYCDVNQLQPLSCYNEFTVCEQNGFQDCIAALEICVEAHPGNPT